MSAMHRTPGDALDQGASGIPARGVIMDVVESLAALRAWRAAVTGSLGFVPTMGALVCSATRGSEDLGPNRKSR